MSTIAQVLARLRAAYRAGFAGPSPASSPARKRKTASAPGLDLAATLDRSRVVAVALFLATVALIVLVSFAGVSNRTLPVLPNQLSPVRIVAALDFTYESRLKTDDARERLAERVPPVYRLDPEPLRRFENDLATLIAAADPARRDQLEAAVLMYNQRGDRRLSPDDLARVLVTDAPETRARRLESALATLRALHAQGIADPRPLGGEHADHLKMFQVLRPDGSVATRPVEKLEEALIHLRVTLAAEESDRPLADALYRLFRDGVVPNLAFDREATLAREADVVRDLRPVSVAVTRGESIIEPDTRVTAEQFEMLEAHRRALAETSSPLDESLRLSGRILLVLAMLAASLIYIRLEDEETLRSNSRLALLALVVVANLALVRATYSLGSLDLFLESTTAAALLPYVAPVLIAPILVALLIDAGSGIFMALFLAIFTSVIWGGRLDLLVLEFLAAMIAIHGVRQTRRRNRILLASFHAGLALATGIMLLGLAERLPALAVAKQMLAGLLAALASGVLVVGLLPFLENLFKRTTDITLLELTDYNHPLLRLMQMEAPGTYHHSLVVAQLAENAAAAIGANPLLARVCALFHDIGKTAKPDYFIENQTDGDNPHDDANPSLSALILKAHVKDGVDLALRHKLPRPVIDVIQQHHGTTLIRYFYQRALDTLRRGRDADAPLPPLLGICTESPQSGSAQPFPALPEHTYRYDGPRPRFKESAIIHLADGVEAAARSLARVTPSHVEEIIDRVVRDRQADGQLDESPLTFAELTRIKTSFQHTLVNMLHGRKIAYPGAPAPVD